MTSLTNLFRNHFAPILVAFVVLGFAVPGVELLPAETMIFFLAMLIFVSSFQITHAEVRQIKLAPPLLFYVVRYPLLAVLLWALTGSVYPSLATAVLLLTLAPAGVASPGVTSIYDGNVSMSILFVVLSSFLAPFLITAVLQVLVARQIHLDILSIFKTLLVSVLIPLLLHMPLRRTRLAGVLRAHDSLFVVPAIGILVMLVVSKQKAFIMAHAVEAVVYVIVAILLFLLYYALGWVLFFRAPGKNRIAFALSSGVNNTAIVIVVAFLYFSAEVSTFLVTTELAWVASMLMFRRFLAMRRRESSMTASGAC